MTTTVLALIALGFGIVGLVGAGICFYNQRKLEGVRRDRLS